MTLITSNLLLSFNFCITNYQDSVEEKRLLSLEKLVHRFLPSNMPPELRAKEAQSILLFASMLSKVGHIYGSYCAAFIFFAACRDQFKCDGTRAETRFRLSAKRTSPFKSAGDVSSVACWQPRCAHQL